MYSSVQYTRSRSPNNTQLHRSQTCSSCTHPVTPETIRSNHRDTVQWSIQLCYSPPVYSEARVHQGRGEKQGEDYDVNLQLVSTAIQHIDTSYYVHCFFLFTVDHYVVPMFTFVFFFFSYREFIKSLKTWTEPCSTVQISLRYSLKFSCVFYMCRSSKRGVNYATKILVKFQYLS